MWSLPWEPCPSLCQAGPQGPLGHCFPTAPFTRKCNEYFCIHPGFGRKHVGAVCVTSSQGLKIVDMGSRRQQSPSPASRAEVVKAGEVTETLPSGNPQITFPEAPAHVLEQEGPTGRFQKTARALWNWVSRGRVSLGCLGNAHLFSSCAL